MSADWLVLIESNTTGSGRLFCARAQDLGMRPVVLVRDRNRYGYLAEDGIETRTLDTADPAALARACAQLPGRIAGITSSSEYYIGTAAELARGLGLAHPDPAAIAGCRDKASQRVLLLAAGVGGPEFAVCRTPDEAAAAAARLGLPTVVKPTTGSGSVGVLLCRTVEQARAAAAAVLGAEPGALGIPQQAAVLVEQYLDGPEFSVETFDREVVGITAKHLGPHPHFIEIGHDFPAMLASEQQAALAGTALSALQALGLGWGPAHLELRLTGAGAAVVEVNPRLAGGMIPRMVHEATGLDLIELAVRRAAGLPVSLRAERSAHAAIRFVLLPGTGRLAAIEGVRDARLIDNVVEVSLTAQPGQQLQRHHSFRDRLGYVISAGQDGLTAARAADLALARIELRLEPGTVPVPPVAEGMPA